MAWALLYTLNEDGVKMPSDGIEPERSRAMIVKQFYLQWLAHASLRELQWS